MKNHQQSIYKLARLVGIVPFYYNYKGEKVDVSFETVLQILSAMGFSLEEDAVQSAIEEIENHQYKNLLEPVYVCSNRAIELYLPEKCENFYLEISPFEELGTKGQTLKLDLHSYDLQKIETNYFDDQLYHKFLIFLPEVEPGYYRFALYLETQEKQSLLIVTPSSSFTNTNDKRWGMHLNLWSLRGQQKEADFSHLIQLSSFIKQYKGFISINPLHLNDPSDCYGISPYSALSREFRTPLYLSVCPVKEKNSEIFEYARVWDEKNRALKSLFEKFYNIHYINHTEEAQKFIEYKNSLPPLLNQELKYFAIFCFLMEKFGKNWEDWNEYKKPDRELVDRIYAIYEKEVLFYEYLQWLVHQEIEKIKDILCMDLGFGSLKRSFDVWFHQQVYALDVESGAPPDDFNPKGQNWGFPPMIPFKLKKQGYLPFIKILKSNICCSMLRIDHALGLFRTFWIPKGQSPQNGAYVMNNWPDLLGIICLESTLNKTTVIAEDLGTSESWMKEELMKRGMLSWKVFYFEKTWENFKSSAQYPKQAICSITTHDLPTLKGFWLGRDIELRKQFSIFNETQAEEALLERQKDKEKIIQLLMSEGLIETEKIEFEDLVEAIIKFLSKTPCQSVLIYLEDLLGIEEQTNFPGTVTEHINWQRKLPLTIEEIVKLPILKKVITIFQDSGRLSPL